MSNLPTASTTSITAVVCEELTFAWDDGTSVVTDLDVVFGAGRTGLVGDNGCGKSTVLRLVAGRLTPASGRVSTRGEVGYLPQRVASDTDRTVSDLLGIGAVRSALQAVERGDATPKHFETLEDNWDVESRAVETLERLGVRSGDDILDRTVRTLSGGEAVLAGVAGLLVRRPPISLLDEPSNNLDRRGRELLYAAVDAWPGVLVVASHDRELLEHVDHIVELRDGSARAFGGAWTQYAATIEAERRTAERRVRHAEGDVAQEKRQLVETQTKLARRRRYGDRASREKREPKVVMNEKKRRAQVSAAAYRDIQTGRLDAARTALRQAEHLVRDTRQIRIDLPATTLPDGRDVLRLGELTIRGPERVALVGDNGSGKTTLLDAVAGRRRHPRGDVAPPQVPTRYLPQRLDLLDDRASALDNVRTAAPTATPQQVRARLAQFLIRGPQVQQPAGSLSAGERFRVTLACLLLAEPAPQLLLLDEPTNALDVSSVGQLVSALRGYRGALLLVSHDARLATELGITRRWRVRDVGLPAEDADQDPRLGPGPV